MEQIMPGPEYTGGVPAIRLLAIRELTTPVASLPVVEQAVQLGHNQAIKVPTAWLLSTVKNKYIHYANIRNH
jgi:hypothetical protein